MAGESARERAQLARQKAERLQRMAQSYERGAEGESATAQVLAQLPVGWTTLHDLRWPGRRYANIDHLVIGPAGVFVVDSKNWSGRIAVDGGVLRQNGRRREPAVAGCADSALAVAELVPTHAEHIKPVLCFVRDEDLRGWSRDVMLCSTSTILEMLLTRPPVLQPAEIDHLRWALDVGTLSALDPSPAQGRPRQRRALAAPTPAPRRRTASRSRSRNRQRAGRELLTGLALLVVLMLFGPSLAQAAGGAISGLLTEIATPADPCAAEAGAAPPTCAPSPPARQQERRPGGR
jgi:hypothetical protein